MALVVIASRRGFSLAVLSRAARQEASSLFELGVDVATGEQAEVPDLGESGRQYVVEESSEGLERSRIMLPA